MTDQPPVEALADQIAEDSSVAHRLAMLGRRVQALGERAMRRAVIAESLENLEAVELVALVVLLHQGAQEGSASARTILQEVALDRTVFAAIPYERIEAAYAIAQQTGQTSIARMFLSAGARNDNPSSAEASTDNEFFPVSVGVRRSAARCNDRFTLDRLLHDRDHRVIANLLNNPRLVEADVIRIAAMRPTRPEILEIVARHRKWANRYRVRKTLTYNPHTPLPIARRLLHTLMRQDLQAVVAAGILRDELHTVAIELLEG